MANYTIDENGSQFLAIDGAVDPYPPSPESGTVRAGK